MTVWDTNIKFDIWFITIAVLVILAFIIVAVLKYLNDDSDEMEVLQDAENFIIEHCNDSNGCTECDRWLEDKACCRYQHYAPWQWRKGE